MRVKVSEALCTCSCMTKTLTSLPQIDPDRDVWCEGRDKPPRNCLNEYYVHKPDYSGCICKDQYYDPDGDSGPRLCELCPKGNYCINGAITPCPAHTYQDNAGQTACKSCTTTRDPSGIYSNCPDKQQLRWCGVGESQIECVPCSRCKRPYITGSENQVNCYRSN